MHERVNVQRQTIPTLDLIPVFQNRRVDARALRRDQYFVKGEVAIRRSDIVPPKKLFFRAIDGDRIFTIN